MIKLDIQKVSELKAKPTKAHEWEKTYINSLTEKKYNAKYINSLKGVK